MNKSSACLKKCLLPLNVTYALLHSRELLFLLCHCAFNFRDNIRRGFISESSTCQSSLQSFDVFLQFLCLFAESSLQR